MVGNLSRRARTELELKEGVVTVADDDKIICTGHSEMQAILLLSSSCHVMCDLRIIQV